MNQAILHSKVYHFADDSNFSYASHSIKKLNKTIDFDLSNLVQWIRANKISLNVNKTELLIFRSRKKPKKSEVSTKWKKIEPNHHTGYLGFIFNEHFSFNYCMNTLKQTVNSVNSVLAKLRYYVSTDILKLIYYALFAHIWDVHVKLGVRLTVKHSIWYKAHRTKL